MLEVIAGSLFRCRLTLIARAEIALTLAVSTKPSRLATTSKIRPSGHLPLEKDSPSTSETGHQPLSSPRFVPLSPFLKSGQMFTSPPAPEPLAKYWTCPQVRLELLSSLLNTVKGQLGDGRRCSK